MTEQEDGMEVEGAADLGSESEGSNAEESDLEGSEDPEFEEGSDGWESDATDDEEASEAVPALSFQEVEEQATQWLTGLLNLAGFEEFSCAVESDEEAKHLSFRIASTGSETSVLSKLSPGTDACVAIESIEALLRNVVERLSDRTVTVALDIEGHIERQTVASGELAQAFSEAARKLNTTMTIAGLSSFDRRIMHKTLAEDKELQTLSLGTGPFRKLCIKPR